MIGGAYKKALEVGFTEQQAAYMAHLSEDTKQQAIDTFEEILVTEFNEIDEELNENIPWQSHAIVACVFLIGFLLGKFL